MPRLALILSPNNPVSMLLMLVGAGASYLSMQCNTELQRLQQEVEMLRLKDLQQEHHIHMLTQQLRNSQTEPSQVQLTTIYCILLE